MSKLLQGIRVIENASVITGPMAGMLLSDLGADVIKVEIPDGGDQFRKWDATEEKVNVSFASYNRGKRSITLNLRAEEGRQIYRDLVCGADVVIENYRPGVMDARALGYEALKEINPRLVYCEISGVGATGPYRDRPTFDAVAQAMSGLWSLLTDVSAPEAVGPPMSDQLSGIYASCAVLGALVSRASTGIGTKVSVNMLSCSMSFIGGSIASYLDSVRQEDPKVPNKATRGVGSQSYSFIDCHGKPFAVHLSTPRKFWEGLCATVGLPAMANDERYDTKRKRIQHFHEIRDTFQPIFAKRDRQSWLDALTSADVPCAPIYTIDEALQDPQVQHLGMVWEDPSSGHQLVKSPIQEDGHFAVGTRATPVLGEHTLEVLGLLGHEEAAVEELRRTGVV
jgi:formyl-CoA transferase